MSIRCWFGIHKFESEPGDDGKVVEKCKRCGEINGTLTDEDLDED